MRIKILFISIAFAVCTIIGLVYGFHRYYSPPQLKQPYKINATPDDTLRIAFIGDSWAFMHKDHECKIATILQDSIQKSVKVHSYGVCGLTSKEIYENIFDNNDLKCLLKKRKFDFCIISAGINDVNKKMSIKYYKDSMDGIISFLLANNIHPIILEIPDFDVYKIYRWWRIDKKILRIISMKINHVPIDCKQLFRDAFDSLVAEQWKKNQLSIIRYISWNNDYHNDQENLYLKDGLHLNEHGYTILDSAIAKEILTCITFGHNTESLQE
jgi:lysophospholipase L1-like esterase